MRQIKYITLFIFTALYNGLYSQIYPTNFIYNGCDYTYNGLLFGQNDSIKCDDNYQLVYEDDFNGTTLDSTNWQTYFPWGRSLNSDRTGTGFERQYYSDNNVNVSAGFLYLTTQTDPGNRDVYNIPSYDPSWMPAHNNVYFNYTSGMIFSKLNFGAGKFEIRGKIPFIDGAWPAFWLYGSCAQEIDAFEFINKSENSDADIDSQNMIMSYHKKKSCGIEAGGQCDNNFTTNCAKNLSDDFHVYSVEWDANKIIWKLDSSIVREVYRIWSISPPPPFGPLYGYALPIKECNELKPLTSYTIFNTFPTEDIKMNIIINTAVGFERGSYPKEFIIDYVRAYVSSGIVLPNTSEFSFLNVYPNPTSENLTISQSDLRNPIREVIVLNILGETMSCPKIITSDRGTIDLSILPKGIYIIKIICEKNTELKKIIYN